MYWYKKWWGLLIAILIFPFFIIWYTWARTNWSRVVKLSVTAVMLLFVLIGLANDQNQTTGNIATEDKAQTSNQTTTTPSSETSILRFDIPSYVGKNIDELRLTLGKPVDNQVEPTALQLAATSTWDNSFKVNGELILVTFEVESRKITEFFIASEDPSGATSDKSSLLKLGNVREDDSRYSVEYVTSLQYPGQFTGIRVTPR